MRTPYRLRAAVPALAVPVLLVALSACGGGGDESADPSPSPSASEAPASASPTPLAGTPVDAKKFTALVDRSLDKATTADIALKLVGSNGTVNGTGQVDYTKKDPSLAIKLPGFGDADLRVIGREVYIKVPSADAGNTFYQGDLDDPAVASQLGSLGGFDPASSLRGLAQSVSEVAKVGRERVQGDPVDHYVFRAAPSGGAVTVDAWFDRQELLRKTQTTLGDGTKVTLTLSDWGAPVDIKAPPASQVKQLPSAAPSQ